MVKMVKKVIFLFGECPIMSLYLYKKKNIMIFEKEIKNNYSLLIIFTIYVVISFTIITYYFFRIHSADNVNTLCMSVYVFNICMLIVLLLLLLYHVIKYRKKNKRDVIRSYYINNIIHDFKSPVTTINLVNQNIMNFRESSEDDISQYVEILNKECSILSIMTESIMNILRDDCYKLNTDEIIDLHEVVKDCVNRMRFSIEGLGGEVINEFSASNSYVKGNYYLLLSVFVNLISNAVKYNDKPPVIKIRTENDDNELIISVIDNGIGIKEEDLDKIFVQFYKVRDRRFSDGLGLGLFFVKDNIERLSGNMLVSSVCGRGSEFRITLPIV